MQCRTSSTPSVARMRAIAAAEELVKARLDSLADAMPTTSRFIAQSISFQAMVSTEVSRRIPRHSVAFSTASPGQRPDWATLIARNLHILKSYFKFDCSSSSSLRQKTVRLSNQICSVMKFVCTPICRESIVVFVVVEDFSEYDHSDVLTIQYVACNMKLQR